MFRPVNPKTSLPEIEHRILTFWKKEHIFKKTLDKNKKGKKFVFFDGPPFANGLPHYGHILASTIKDAVTRYWTMRGYYVPRRNGWDCHGLPVEYEIEKELGLSGKAQIEKMGIAKFNQKCRESVFRYTGEWEDLLSRIARWVDFDDSYATLENSYIESIWWVFNTIWNKKMVYKGHKSMHICPRCVTPLSNFEVSLGYKEITDLAITVKFELVDEPGTYCIAWTTTPWSVISVMGLAVGKNIEYVKIKTQSGCIILAKNRLEQVMKNTNLEYEIIDSFKGSKLVGKKFKHVFDLYNNHPQVKKSKKAFSIVATEYVTDEDGTGIATINGAFGDVDMEAAKHYKLPIIVNLNMEGNFLPEVKQFAGKFAKSQDQNIGQLLSEKELLLKKENYRHSYPHCWRCDTPLLMYATEAWFIKVSQLRKKLLANNQKIHWQPEHIKQGRFGKWLENVKDWNISRNRYWGAPLPIWQCRCGENRCIGSIDDLSKKHPKGVKIIIARHAEYTGNIKKILNSDQKKKLPLTPKGKKQAKLLAKKLSKENIVCIYTSPLHRTQQTADIISTQLKIPVIVDQRLRERNMGQFEGKKVSEFLENINQIEDELHNNTYGQESMLDVKLRMKDFINQITKKHPGQSILVISHGDPLLGFEGSAGRLSDKQMAYKSINDLILKNCESRELYVGNNPKNEAGELDLHKPYIDSISLACEKCGKPMQRIPEVLDCWFESGAMPYAQLHYPFEKKEEFEKNFPADFIGEGLDQTRGWFYTLHVLSTILFNKPAFKQVIVNGILLAADGEKLSKRKKNYPDPNILFETKGVDSTRFFLLASNAPLAEDVRFSEAHVEDIVKRLTLTLWNTYSFFVTYAAIDKWKPQAKKQTGLPKNKLDQWILSELNLLISEITEDMNGYNLTKATRPVLEFVDNLSNWYIRRSRRRFWKSQNDTDKHQAYQTLYTVLITLSKLLAPFMPFISEEMYQNLTDKLSVHLENWPATNKKHINKTLHQEIKLTRQIVALGHAARAKRNIKVRQPLSLVQIGLPRHLKPSMLKEQTQVILEELNVKELKIITDLEKHVKQSVKPNPKLLGPKYGKDVQQILMHAKNGNFSLLEDGSVRIEKWTLTTEEINIGFEGKPGFDVESEQGIVVVLDTTITGQLKKEGYAREIVRHVQELRKESGYQVADRIYTFIQAESELEKTVTQFADYIKQETLSIELQQSGQFEWDKEKTVDIEGNQVKIALRKK